MNQSFLTTLQNSKNYTLAVAEAMPENQFTCKPAGAGWNFAELLNHIAYGIAWWQDNYVKGISTDWSPPATKLKKIEVIADLEKAYTTLTNWIEKNELTEKARQGFNATIDHVTHHRGQAVIYLRLNKISPPDYTY